MKMIKKKIFSVVLLGMILLFLFGCSSGVGKETKTKMKQEANGVTVVMTLVAKGDTITRIDQNASIDITNLTEEQIQAVNAACETAKANFAEIKGTSYSYSQKGQTVTETIVIPTDSATLKKAIEKKLLPVDDANISRLSLKKTQKNLENSGWTSID